MTKQHLLLVDADPRSLRMMEVSLRKAGFTVTTAANGKDALAECERAAPDLVLSDTRMPELDGFELCRRLKQDERLRATPFIFLTDQKSVEEKVRGLELGVEDYLTKPIYVREVVTRVKILLDRRARERLERHDQRERRASFSGRLAELGVVDLVQTLDIGKKSGAVSLRDAAGRQGTIWFRDGRLIDCEVAHRTGEAAFYRLLRWERGDFSIDFTAVDRPERIQRGTQALLLEGVRRQDEWARVRQRLPPLERALQIDYRLLSQRLAEIPDDVNAILRLVDGQRTLSQLLEESEHDELATGGILARLCEERILVPVAAASDAPPSDSATDSSPTPGGEAGVDWLAGPAEGAPAPDPEKRGDGGTGPLASDVAHPAADEAAPADEAALPRIVRFVDRRRPPQDALLRSGAPTPALFDPPPGGMASGGRPTPRPARATPVPARPTPRPGPAPARAATATPRPARAVPRPASAAGPRRARPGLLAVTALVAVVAGGLAVGLLSGRAPRTAEAMPPVAGEEAKPPSVAAGAAVPPAPREAAVDGTSPTVSAAEPAPAAVVGPAGYEGALAEAQREHAAGRLSLAAAAYRRALSLRETSVALEGLGRALHEDRQVEPALAALRRAIELDEANAAAYIALGRVYLDEQRPHEARSAFRRYLALEPEGGHAGEARAALRETP